MKQEFLAVCHWRASTHQSCATHIHCTTKSESETVELAACVHFSIPAGPLFHFFKNIFDEATDREVMKRKVTSSQSIPEFIYLFSRPLSCFPSQVTRWIYVCLIFFKNAVPSEPCGEIVLSRLQCGRTRQEAGASSQFCFKTCLFQHRLKNGTILNNKRCMGLFPTRTVLISICQSGSSCDRRSCVWYSLVLYLGNWII